MKAQQRGQQRLTIHYCDAENQATGVGLDLSSIRLLFLPPSLD